MSDEINGILPLYKPTGLTSHDVVDQVRHVIGQQAVGHVGTLDPAAEGLLILCLGKSTKLARYLSGQNKAYRAEIALGRTSSTWDEEGVDLTSRPEHVPPLTTELLESTLDQFRGEINQQVPAFSAVRQGGERLYKKARRHEPVETPIRQVTISLLKLISFEPDRLMVDVECTKGTYIRSLAHEIGQVLGCGGYLAELIRTRIGRIDVERSCRLTELKDLFAADLLRDRFVSADEALGFSAVLVNNDFAARVSNGQRPTGSDLSEVDGSFLAGDAIMVKDRTGKLLAIARATHDSNDLGGANGEAMLSYERVLV